MLSPRRVNLVLENGYIEDSDLASRFSTKIYQEILLSAQQGKDLSKLSIRPSFPIVVSAQTIAEFWMTASDIKENFPLFGDVCFYRANDKANRYRFAFSPGERFDEMRRDGEKPFYALANIRFRDVAEKQSVPNKKIELMHYHENINIDPEKLEARLRARGIVL